MIQTRVLLEQFMQNKTDENMNRASDMRKTNKDSKACPTHRIRICVGNTGYCVKYKYVPRRYLGIIYSVIY